MADTEDHRMSSFPGRARSAMSHIGQDDHIKQITAVAKTVAVRAGDVSKAISRKVAQEASAGGRNDVDAGADPWPEAESEHLVRVQPVRIGGYRSHRT